ncbi:MAG: hypothetical protein PHS02_00120, partial [Candidatus ainarchaeum sp.]|nr:hypothetical protein [Candidatus ainarchaeum sp.]
MNNDLKAALLTLAIFLGAALMLYVGYHTVPFDNLKVQFQLRLVTDVLTLVDLVLIAFLLVSYSKSYLKLKSEFTLGLVLFLACMLLFVMSSSHTMLEFLGFFSGNNE